MTFKKWCSVCNFLTYGGCHVDAPRPAATTRSDLGASRAARRPALMPLTCMAVPGSANFTVSSSPVQVRVTPRRLFIPQTIAHYFFIEDIRIGKQTCFASSGLVDALVFCDSGVDNMLGAPEIEIGQEFAIQGVNRADHVISFSAVLIVDELPPGAP